MTFGGSWGLCLLPRLSQLPPVAFGRQIGAQYGPAPADLAAITNWLTSQGFTVKSVAPDGMTVKFAGTAGTVQSAFHTSIHSLAVHGLAHYANMTNPQIPAALAPVVVGVKALHNFLPKPLHKMGSLVQFNADKGKWQRIAAPGSGLAGTSSSLTTSTRPSLSALAAFPKASLKALPQYGINANYSGSTYLEEDVTPWDFATIYNVTPAWTAGYTGTGQTIAIAGTSEICLGQSGSPCDGENDVSTYRSEFDLPAGMTPVQTDTGMGPAATVCTGSTNYCSGGDQVENTLDTELAGSVATGAQIKLYVTGQIETGTNAGSIDTTYDSASYIVEHQAAVGANILSLSYGECELFQGTAENVAYYDLWQSAAAEGISVFVASGDSGSPACDDALDYSYGNPYVAQYGLSVNGMASTPYNTAVGGTDFSWCQPYFSGNNFAGCATSSTSQGTPAYWGTSNNSSNGSSALGYVPEIPWNDTCENPIVSRYLATFLTISGTPEQVCNYIENNWQSLDQNYSYQTGSQLGIEYYVDAVGGGGGVSGCVANDAATVSSTTMPTCTANATSTGATTNPDTGVSQAALPLTDDGWPVPSWQTGVTGISGLGLTTRALPDVSFFSGVGLLDSATLVCVQSQGSCTLSNSVENTAQEIGGTSIATPEMAGVMALINQKAGAPQGLANPELYKLASQQTYSDCSAEKVTASSSCYFQDIDSGPTASSGSAFNGTETTGMPCALSAGTPEGGDQGGYSTTLAASPNCYPMSSGDSIGTLGISSTTPAYNSTAGFDLATGLGSLNVANVVNAWVSDAGTDKSTIAVTLTPSTGTVNPLSDGATLTVAVTMTGIAAGPAPTGTIAVSGGGYSGSGPLSSTGTNTSSASVVIPAGSLGVGDDTLTITYSGDGTYASNSTTESVTVAAATPIVTVTAPAAQNVANPVLVTVAVAGPAGIPTSGSVTLTQTGGSYSSAAQTLTSSSGGILNFTIPKSALTAGTDTLTAMFGGDSSYTSGSGTASITMSSATTLSANVKVTPNPASIDTGQLLVVDVAVSGSGAIPTGTVSLTAGTYTSTAMPLVTGATSASASFTVSAGSFTTAGSPTITATYSGDAVYGANTGSATETVALSTYALAASASTPTSIAPGATATSTITGTKSTTNYTGTVTLNSCTVTSGPTTGTAPTCGVSGTITYASGVATGSGTATVSTTAASSAELARPKVGNGRGWLGGGAVLAFLVFLGVPARRKSWRAMLGMVVLLVTLGSLAACGGGGSSGGGGGGTGVPATAAGAYTFTVSGTGNDAASTTASTTFTVTVN